MGDRLTDDEIEAMRERCESVIDREWERVDGKRKTYIKAGTFNPPPRGEESDFVIATVTESSISGDVGDFIANARQDLPRALDEVERLRGAIRDALNAEFSREAHDILSAALEDDTDE